jgi:tRNA(Ile)-lysidine synthase
LARARLGVAVSGGPDSMALLALAARACPGQVEAATVDHGLRVESADEARMVADWCGAQDIPHTTLVPASPITGSLQAAARQVRYRLLEQWRADRGLDFVLTAHHADDQAETLLMRLNRGAGTGGLAGVRECNGAVLRPLLGWRRAELAQVVGRLALPHVIDPSNSDLRFDRVAMRQQLAGADWIDPVALARSAGALAEGEDALGWMATQIGDRHIVPLADGQGLLLDKTDLPREILRRLLLRMYAVLSPDAGPPRGASVDHALILLASGNKAMLGDLLIHGGNQWEMRAAPPRRAG